MNTHYVHHLDPILLKFGVLQIRWYGLMYLIGFIVGYYQFVRRYKRGLFALDPERAQLLITYLMVGMMIGARLIYVLVYNPMYYWNHLGEIVAIWEGGLSFHGAAIGFVIAMWLFSKNEKVGFFHLTDSVVLGSATGIFFGRIGNFINGELFGRTTDVPWGIIFPLGGQLPRHPSQLYQGFGEGLCVFLILLLIQKREQKLGFAPQGSLSFSKKAKIEWKRTGIMGSSFLILYAVARFIIEFFREPDPQLGFFSQYFTMGQILCAIMGGVGIWILRARMKHPIAEAYPAPAGE